MAKKSSVQKITTATQSILTNASTTDVYKVFNITVSNKTTSPVTLMVEVVRAGDGFKLFSDASIPAKSNVSVFGNKDFGLFLERGDALRLSASADNSLEAICSYESVIDPNPPRFGLSSSSSSSAGSSSSSSSSSEGSSSSSSEGSSSSSSSSSEGSSSSSSEGSSSSS